MNFLEKPTRREQIFNLLYFSISIFTFFRQWNYLFYQFYSLLSLLAFYRACIYTTPYIIIIDIGELDGGKVATVTFPKVNDLSNFNVVIKPDSGYWKGATYKFVFVVPPHYPHSPPKVDCTTKIYHPNIDLQGKVCLNILREDWRPVMDINSVIYGLIYLFYEPNADDPLNHEAADLFRKDIKSFERLVNRTLRGGTLDGVSFERLVK